ncbi:unnamed protein product, partial [Staurois parvus]
MTDSGPGSSMRRRYIGAYGRLGAWQQLWGPVICQHPMSKNSTHQQCVRRPESGTWQSVAMETAAMGVPTWAPWPRLTFWP